jgi:glycerophosphoryl diester phosphodiesterase
MLPSDALGTLHGHRLLVAHRAGNDLDALDRAVAAGAQWIEFDVHRLRGRHQVRHEKALLWSTRWFYEGRRVVRAFDCPDPAAVDAAVPPSLGLLVDVKGFHPRLAAVLGAIAADRPTIVSTRHWYVLRSARSRRVIRCWSVGNRLQRLLARALVSPRRVDAVAVHSRLVTPDLGRTLRGRVPTLLSWGLRDAEHAAFLVACGVNGLIVDDLDLLATLAALAGRREGP